MIILDWQQVGETAAFYSKGPKGVRTGWTAIRCTSMHGNTYFQIYRPNGDLFRAVLALPAVISSEEM